MSFATRALYVRALEDIRAGLRNVHLWPMLAWLEIKHRYRRSLLGPLWLTLSTAVFIGGMGSLYGMLFGQSRAPYIHYLAVGVVVWIYIAGLINDGCQTFIAAEGLIKQTKLPLTVYALRVVWRNFLIFAHNFIIIVVVSAYFMPEWDWGLLTSAAGIVLIALNGLALSLSLGLTSARFRDIPQIVASIVQLLFFITPIFWRPAMLTAHPWIADWNPIFHFVELVRAPILGGPIPVDSWLIALTLTVLTWVIAFGLFARFRARIAYWA